MFNVGGGELLVILVIALIVLGPSRLPDAARTIGKTMGEIRRLSTGFQDEVRSALNSADDPNQVATRRNVLSPAEVKPAGNDERPPRTTPLVAAPADVPAPAEPAPTRSTPAKAKAAAPKAKTTKVTPAKATTTKAAKPKNGTAVKKPAASKSPARPPKSS